MWTGQNEDRKKEGKAQKRVIEIEGCKARKLRRGGRVTPIDG